MMKARRLVVENFHEDEDVWERNFATYREAPYEFEAAVRTVVARGRI